MNGDVGHDVLRISIAITAIIEAGWKVRWVDYCEDADTPGLLGQIRGVTDRRRHEVKVATKPHDSWAQLADTLEHELRHVREPEWDCGNRDVLGRGGPRP